jgi:hypothetical protein
MFESQHQQHRGVACRSDSHGIPAWRHFQIRDLTVLHVSFDGGSIRRVKFGVRCPIIGPRGRSWMRLPAYCISISSNVIMPVPPLSRSGIQSCPGARSGRDCW